MKPFFKQYENGLRLIFKKVEANRPASLFIAVDVGSSKEDEKTSGISHFIEHLNFKGTEKRTAKQISTELEEIGANANAFTSKSTTCFFATCLGEKIEQCFEEINKVLSKHSAINIIDIRIGAYTTLITYAFIISSIILGFIRHDIAEWKKILKK